MLHIVIGLLMLLSLFLTGMLLRVTNQRDQLACKIGSIKEICNNSMEPEPIPKTMYVKKHKTDRGFEIISFRDHYGKSCSIQESSSWNPTVWIGIDDPEPKIMAVDANKLNIKTKGQSGWVLYDIPKEVSINTRMILDRKELRAFIDILEEYYANMPKYDESEEE